MVPVLRSNWIWSTAGVHCAIFLLQLHGAEIGETSAGDDDASFAAARSGMVRR